MISQSIIEKAKSIRLLVLDVDGVLTDATLLYGAQGEIGKTFHVRDGIGIKALLRAGIHIAIISGRNSAAVEHRMQELGIEWIFQGVSDKLPQLKKIQAELKFSAQEIAAVGDDLPDLEVLRYVGLSVAVADAHTCIIDGVDYRTSLPGGHGAVREVCDLILNAIAHR